MRRPLPWRRVLFWSVAGLLGAQAIVIITLTIITQLRKRRAPPANFPHGTSDPVEVDGTQTRIYTYGQDLYDAMLHAIDNAQETIFLDTFIWKNDELGQDFKQRLVQKAKAGVQVYVIFDGFGNMVVSPRFKRFPPVVHALKYRSWHHLWDVIDIRRYARDHHKLLVVDNTLAFIGGYNIGALYATQWRDTHMHLQGPGAIDLAFAFVDFWNTHKGRHLPRISLDVKRDWQDHITVPSNDPLRLLFPIRGMYLNAINRAQHHIYLTSAYFIPNYVIMNALVAAAHRGVDVRVLVPWESNHVTADWVARGFFGTCLRNGIKVYGYKDAMIHAKTATIDGVWSTVGTANLDRLSLAGNYEMNVEIHNADFAAALEHAFMIDLTNAFKLTHERWAHRAWYDRISEIILRQLRPLL